MNNILRLFVWFLENQVDEKLQNVLKKIHLSGMVKISEKVLLVIVKTNHYKCPSFSSKGLLWFFSIFIFSTR